MATSKKPRKKRDNSGRKASDQVCKNSFIISVLTLGQEGSMWVKNNKPVLKGGNNAREYALTFNVPRPWSFFLGAYCRTPLGDTYIKGQYVQLRNQLCLQSQAINDFIDEEIHQVIDDVNSDHLLSPFFIASPEKQEFSDEFINRLMRWLNVEKQCKTPYEICQLRDKGMEALRQIDPIPYTDKTLWTWLKRYDIHSFADIRLQGLSAVQKLKGIGEKRVKQIEQGYHDVLNDPTHEQRLQPLFDFELSLMQREDAIKRVTKPR